jgi:hypothetical protein
MEFFIPSILIFLLAIGFTIVISPRMTPLIVAILSVFLLSFGVHSHYKIFKTEYHLSTWQDSLKIYAPAAMIAAICIFIIYSILSFFSKGEVPVPITPNISLGEPNTATNKVTETINDATKSIGDIFNNMKNTISGNNNGNTNTIKSNNTKSNNKNNQGLNQLTRSFLETL